MMPALHSGLLPVPVRSSEDSDVGRDSTTFPLRPVLSRRRTEFAAGKRGFRSEARLNCVTATLKRNGKDGFAPLVLHI